MGRLLERIQNAQISRRDFLKGSAVATSALMLAGCGDPSSNVTETTKEAGTTNAPVVEVEPNPVAYVSKEDEAVLTGKGKWVSAACWHNCGGRCMNKAYVVDGVVIRQKTDDTHEDSWEYPQQRGCVRGKAQQQQCFGVDRIKYPMKRKNWQPGGGENSHGELRGKDEWERISWDEAFRLFGEEMTRIKDTYGMESVLYPSGRDGGYRVLNAMGGCINTWSTISMGTYKLDVRLAGLPLHDWGKTNDRFDLENAEVIVMHSMNPAWASTALPTYFLRCAKEKGIKFISIDPMYTESAQLVDAEWLPIRGGTDISFFLGAAYEMLRLDKEEGDIVDWEFLNKYTVGFDAEHMPADAKLNENYQDYLLGKYDGIPKTAEWASHICGVPAEQIISFARTVGKKNKVMLFHNFAAARCYGAEMLPQAFMALGAMGGHMGKSGHACGAAYHAKSFNHGPTLVYAGTTQASTVAYPMKRYVPEAMIWDLVNQGGGSYKETVGPYVGGFTPCVDATLPEIHAIVALGAYGMLQTTTGMKEAIKGYRKMDFVATKAQFFTTVAKYADLVFPVTTEWERVGSTYDDKGSGFANREVLLVASQVVPPLYEAKTDEEIDKGLMEAVGIDTSEIFVKSEKQQFFDQLAGAQVIKEDGSGYETLVTVTQEDIDEWGVEGTPQEGRIGLQELIDNGGYQVRRTAGDSTGCFIGYKDFIDDPEANPLPSKSGKFEIYCQARFDLLDTMFGGIDFKPYPTYVVPPRGYESTFVDYDIDGEKTEYPYIMYNPHYLRRSHSTFDNCSWLREVHPNPVFLSAIDAEEKGVKAGDTVLVSSPFGKCLRKAAVLDNLRPGQVGIPHGAWADIDEEAGIDKAGADNYLTGNDISGCGVTGYNNGNCNFEKWDGEELEDDWHLPHRLVTFAE